eukprot:GAHX01000039.1.p1 GENE.GAHX01000039.1~~GAHX01000039.1.p1  ORF type:complete len:639 (-),score=130.09 GAHX01000039.1:659-2575(-)
MSVIQTTLGRINSISGPLVIATGMKGISMFELVYIGSERLMGETIRVEGNFAYIQSYESTSGLRVGDIVARSLASLCVELGPGLCGNIYDGIQRPLKFIEDKTGSPYIPHGVEVNRVSREIEWPFVPCDIKKGDIISVGQTWGSVKENNLVTIKLTVPTDLVTAFEDKIKHQFDKQCQFEVVSIKEEGNYTVETELIEIKSLETEKVHKLNMLQKWPVRNAKPLVKKVKPHKLLISGQRVIDSFFPATLGGTCCIPGAFGCGKTVVSQALSKYANVDLVVYVGCGERGNEMAEILQDFPALKFTKDGNEYAAMDRTIVIANTSNMPVAAREASIYTGITIAEYFRDMGLNVALMADSTSRWAEALREISGRLGEMPADNGYPAYLGARLAAFYERAGACETIQFTKTNQNDDDSIERNEGTVTVIGAVSPPGGDFSDPVTSATLSNVQVFWGLDKRLAKRKHFPAINWLISYSKYNYVFESEELEELNISDNFYNNIKIAKDILQQEEDLLEVVQLVGTDSLSDIQKLVLQISRILKEDFLQQNSYSTYDKFCDIKKTKNMIKTVVYLYNSFKSAIEDGKVLTGDMKNQYDHIHDQLKDIYVQIADMKFIQRGESDFEEKFGDIIKGIDSLFMSLESN